MNIAGIRSAAVIGAGAWGTTVANLVAAVLPRVVLWAHEPEVVESVTARRINELFLPGTLLEEGLQATSSYEEALADAELVLWAIPVQYSRQRLRECSRFIKRDAVLVNLSKGLEDGTWCRPSQIILQECQGLKQVGSLSGPNIALEIAQGKPAEAMLALANHWEVRGLERLLSTETFKVRLGPDLVALEIAGALKNVVAIAAGFCDGLGLGNNAKSIVVARGFEEMRTLGRALGANPDSFVSPYGMGDLVVTCFSSKSRNRFLGELLGAGRTFAEAIEALHGRVAEGVITSKACYELCERLELRLPLMHGVHRVIKSELSPARCLAEVVNNDE